MRIAIIPARCGSKGLTDKNIKLLGGKPLIAYTIEAAQYSNCFDEVYVSTDSAKYAEIARKYGASVPFLRDKENATDCSSSWDLVREAIKKYESIGRTFDQCMLLQPTSPFRSKDDIRNVIDFWNRTESNCVVSVCEVDHPVQWCFQLSEKHSMEDFSRSIYRNKSRQELKTYYRENGAIYFVPVEKIKDVNYDIYRDHCFGYVMPRERSIDIDTLFDFLVAETILHYFTYKE